MTVIEIRPHRWGWKAFEAPGVEPVFPKKDQAIDYAQNRACFRSGKIHVLDSTGNVERTIAFSEADRKLGLRIGELGKLLLEHWELSAPFVLTGPDKARFTRHLSKKFCSRFRLKKQAGASRLR